MNYKAFIFEITYPGDKHEDIGPGHYKFKIDPNNARLIKALFSLTKLIESNENRVKRYISFYKRKPKYDSEEYIILNTIVKENWIELNDEEELYNIIHNCYGDCELCEKIGDELGIYYDDEYWDEWEYNIDGE